MASGGAEVDSLIASHILHGEKKDHISEYS